MKNFIDSIQELFEQKLTEFNPFDLDSDQILVIYNKCVSETLFSPIGQKFQANYLKDEVDELLGGLYFKIENK